MSVVVLGRFLAMFWEPLLGHVLEHIGPDFELQLGPMLEVCLCFCYLLQANLVWKSFWHTFFIDYGAPLTIEN